MKGKKHTNAFLAATVFASVVPHTANVEAETKTTKFTDIEDSYAKNEIVYLTNKGKLFGMTDTTFEPFTKTTREQMAAILNRLMELPENTKGTKFKDVSPWARNVVGALENKNIIAGYNDTTFGALDTLTREQMAVFFIRAMGYEEIAGKINLPLKYGDVADFSDWSKPIVAFASEIGILVGFPDGKYYPKKETLRQDLAAVAYRYLSPESDKNPYIEKAEELVKKYTQKLEFEPVDITKENATKYPVKGKTKPNQEVEVTISHKEGEGDSITKTVKADEDGNFEVEFDISKFPDAELEIKVTTWDNEKIPESKTENVVKDIDDDEEVGDKVEVTSIYPTDKTVVAVEYKNAPKGDEVYTFNGKKVAPENVKVEGNKVFLTVPEMQGGTEYPVLVEDKDGGKIYEGKVKLDDLKEIPTEITATPSSLTLQVGDRAKVQFKAKKADGTPAKNADIRVKVTTLDSTNNEQIVEEKTIKTNAEGIAEYEYTSLDIREDKIDAVAVQSPMVRIDNPTTVNWNIAEKGLVTVTPTDDVVQGAGTYRDYAVNFKDSNGNPLPYGTDVYVYLGESASATTVLKGDFVKVAGQDQYAKATIANYNGDAKLQLKDVAGKTIKPLFYYDKMQDNTDYKYDGNDPRAVGGSVKYVKQTPTIVMRDLSPGKVDIGANKEVEISVIDQFGKPYVGQISLGMKESIDNSTATSSGSIGFTYKATGDAGYTVNGTVPANTETPEVIDFGALYENGVKEGKIQATISGGLDKEKGTLVAFTDLNNNGFDQADYFKEIEVQFSKKKIEAVHITGPQFASKDSWATYELTFKDEEGKDRPLKKTDNSNLVVQVLDPTGKVIQDLTSPLSTLEMETDMKSREDGTADWAEGVGATAGYLSYTPVADEYNKIAVSFKSNAAGKYTIRAFIDETVGTTAPNNKYDIEEAVSTVQLEVKEALLTASSIDVNQNYGYNNQRLGFKYNLTDQSNNPYINKESVNAEFKIFNDGDKKIKIETENGATYEIEAGSTYVLEDLIKANKGSYTIYVTPQGTNGATNVHLEANLKDRSIPQSEADIYWVDLAVDEGNFSTTTSDRIYEGEIVGYKEQEYSSPSKWYILKTQVGYIKVDFDYTTDNANHTYIVDNNTDMDGKTFEKTLTTGDVVNVQFNQATGKVVHKLTNK